MLRGKRWKWAAGLLAGACLALALGLCFARQLLYVESASTSGDCIVVLGGDVGTRTTRAAELFKEGAAPRIIVTGWGECDEAMLRLTKRGVPKQNIKMESNARTTRQNAQFTLPMLVALHAKKVILVTSWYHSRRALACFRKYGPGIDFYSLPAQRKDHGLWPIKSERGDVVKEYFKLVGYWVCYGVSPVD